MLDSKSTTFVYSSGLEVSFKGIWTLFLAISVHATAILFLVGTDLIASGVKKSRMIPYIVVLSLVTPVGIIIGKVIFKHF